MSHVKTIAIGGALIAAAALLSGPANTGTYGARYQVSVHGEQAWRVDRHTGEMMMCRTYTVKRSDATQVLRPEFSNLRVICFDKDGRVRKEFF